MLLFIATSNQGKRREFEQMLAPHGIQVRSLQDLDDPPDIEETGQTFVANARIKARRIYQLTGQPTLADDSGLVVDALDGQPGVHSGRYAGVQGPGRNAANRARLLAELAGVAEEQRTARFVCALVYIDDRGEEHLFEGRCEGRIGFQERGDSGFGYDSLFVDMQLGRTFAQLDPAEKGARSHRGRAVREYFTYLTGSM